MEDLLLYEPHEGIVTLTMKRPQVRNAPTEQHQRLELATQCARPALG